MENKARVLAYSKAKQIDPREMSDISGGGVHWSHHETLKPSGGSGGVDAAVDVSIDFD